MKKLLALLLAMIMIMGLVACTPEEGDDTAVVSPNGAHARFVVLDMDNLRIDKIRVVLHKEEQQEDA